MGRGKERKKREGEGAELMSWASPVLEVGLRSYGVCNGAMEQCKRYCCANCGPGAITPSKTVVPGSSSSNALVSLPSIVYAVCR